MAYTTEDLTQVRRAIVDLASGQRVTRITKDGRTVEYQSGDLGDLQALERLIAEELLAPNVRRRSRTRLVTTTKGL